MMTARTAIAINTRKYREFRQQFSRIFFALLMLSAPSKAMNDDGCLAIQDGMCNATVPTIQPKCPQHELLQSPHLIIDDLRSRLFRRNQLLDTIRKAYHRDVIAVREYLIDLSDRGILPNNQDVHSFLSTVP